MTQYEPTLIFSQDSIGETYHIWDERLEKWVKGTLTELGTDTICFQWEDMQYDTEYQIFDLPLIVPDMRFDDLVKISPLYAQIMQLVNRVFELHSEAMKDLKTNFGDQMNYTVLHLMQEFKIEKL